ncbi:unnamed protein product, partial [Cladocopium goreaui]
DSFNRGLQVKAQRDFTTAVGRIMVHNITALQEEIQSQLDLLDAMQSAARSLQ